MSDLACSHVSLSSQSSPSSEIQCSDRSTQNNVNLSLLVSSGGPNSLLPLRPLLEGLPKAITGPILEHICAQKDRLNATLLVNKDATSSTLPLAGDDGSSQFCATSNHTVASDQEVSTHEVHALPKSTIDSRDGRQETFLPAATNPSETIQDTVELITPSFPSPHPPLATRVAFMFEGETYKLGDWVVLKSDGPRDWVACVVEYMPPAENSGMNLLLGVDSEVPSEGSIRCQWAWHVEELKDYVLPDLDVTFYSAYEIVPCLDTDINPIESIQRRIRVIHYSEFAKLDKYPPEYKSWPPDVMFWRQIYLGEGELVPALPNEVYSKTTTQPDVLTQIPKNPDWLYWLCKSCNKLHHPNAVRNVKQSKYQLKRYPSKADKHFLCSVCTMESTQKGKTKKEVKSSTSRKKRKAASADIELAKPPITDETTATYLQPNENIIDPLSNSEKKYTEESSLPTLGVMSDDATYLPDKKKVAFVSALSSVDSWSKDNLKDISSTQPQSLQKPTEAVIATTVPQKSGDTISKAQSTSQASLFPLDGTAGQEPGQTVFSKPFVTAGNLSRIPSKRRLQKPLAEATSTEVEKCLDTTVKTASHQQQDEKPVFSLKERLQEHHVHSSERRSIVLSDKHGMRNGRGSSQQPHFSKLRSSFALGFSEMKEAGLTDSIKYSSPDVIAHLVFDKLISTFKDAKEKRQRFHDISENLRRENNPDLRRKILSGELEVSKLITMDTYQLAPDSIQREREEQRNKYFEKQVKLTEPLHPIVRETYKGLENIEKDEAYSAFGAALRLPRNGQIDREATGTLDADNGTQHNVHTSSTERDSVDVSSNDSDSSSSTLSSNSSDGDSDTDSSSGNAATSQVKGETAVRNLRIKKGEELEKNVAVSQPADVRIVEGSTANDEGMETPKDTETHATAQLAVAGDTEKLSSSYRLPPCERFTTTAVKTRLMQFYQDAVPVELRDTLDIYLSIAYDRINELKVICNKS